MTDKTLFEKIINGDICADIIYEDEQCIAIKDIAPQLLMQDFANHLIQN